MSYIEIAESLQFPAIFSYQECPDCGLIANNLDLIRIDSPCPHCGQPGPRSMYPDGVSMTLLKTISHFYKVAHYSRTSQVQALQDLLEQETGKRPSATAIRNAKLQLQRMYSRNRGSADGYEQMLRHAQDTLSVPQSTDVGRVLMSVLSYSEAQPEHVAVVLITCTMVERLLQEMLVEIRVRTLHESTESARQIVDRRRGGVRPRMELLEDMLGISLKALLVDLTHSAWESNWAKLSGKRNDFLHKGQGQQIGASDSEAALKVALDAAWVFGQTRNRLLKVGQS